MTLFADLHRHLGGSAVPRVLWKYLEKTDNPICSYHEGYEAFREFYTSKKDTLEEFLEVHKIVEHVQTVNTLPYFIKRLVRGAYTFENIAYLELRYTPYLRTDRHLSETDRLDQMWDVVDVIRRESTSHTYPVVVPQIVCLHSSLPTHINQAMLNMAIENESVCAIDVAGSDIAYKEKEDDFVSLFAQAKEQGLKTTGHLYETKNGCNPKLLPLLDRIGHGIQIPLQHPELLRSVVERGQCLEVCPTSYLKTGTLHTLEDVKVVFDRCFDAGVDVAICTDNAGLHDVRLPKEYEQLITNDIISFEQLEECQRNAFKHAFAWPYENPPVDILRGKSWQDKT